MTPAGEILVHSLERPPTLGNGRLICLDGPSGSGKSTIAREIAAATGAAVVHTDDLCPGWDGIGDLPTVLHDLLAPLATGRTGRQPRYDWILGHHVEDVVVTPGPLLVVEGVGAGARTLANVTTTLVWVDADPGLRHTRALRRDGEYFAEHWSAWAAAEELFFAADEVQLRADLTYWTG